MKPLTATIGPLYTADAVKIIERKACALADHELFVLMQRAGQAAWDYLVQHYPRIENITIVAGSGNNAGDGFILAQIAHSHGMQVQVLTVRESPTYQGDAQKALQQMLSSDITVKHFTVDRLVNTELVVDAILGTGLAGPLREEYLQVIEAINHWRDKHDVAIVSLDIPSGLNADTGQVDPQAIVADRCLSFVNLKAGMVTAKAREYCGKIDLDELAVSEKSRIDIPITAYIDDADALIHQLPKRPRASHKGSHGHLLLIGGDDGFGGAILMATQAAARVGVGRFTIVTKDSHVAPFLTQFPEAMIRSIENPDGEEFQQLISRVDAIVIGPGLGLKDWGLQLLLVTLKSSCPLVIDADGLNLLAATGQSRENWVLTPHPGEAARLLDTSVATIENNRYHSVGELQSKFKGTAILKGAGTLISNGHFTTVCTEGNPGMASAGMGDILSGIIGSLLAQKIEPFNAARTAVALHARSADIAAQAGEKGLLATDLLGPLRQLVND